MLHSDTGVLLTVYSRPHYDPYDKVSRADLRMGNVADCSRVEVRVVLHSAYTDGTATSIAENSSQALCRVYACINDKACFEY